MSSAKATVSSVKKELLLRRVIFDQHGWFSNGVEKRG
jgi:hypothetical protein